MKRKDIIITIIALVFLLVSNMFGSSVMHNLTEKKYKYYFVVFAFFGIVMLIAAMRYSKKKEAEMLFYQYGFYIMTLSYFIYVVNKLI